MIYINKENLNKFKNLNLNSTYIVTDFDRTITNAYSNSSWALLSKSSLVNKDYIEDRDKLFNYYHPIEIDNTLSYSYKNAMMIEWWQKHIGLLIKYNITEDMVRDNALKTGFLEEKANENLEAFKSAYDVVCTNNASIDELLKVIKEYIK